MAASLTVLLPYDKVASNNQVISLIPFQINPNAAFADAFEQKGIIWAKYVVSVGALLGMLNNQVICCKIIKNNRCR